MKKRYLALCLTLALAALMTACEVLNAPIQAETASAPAPTVEITEVETITPEPTSTPEPTPVPTPTATPVPQNRSQTSGKVIPEGTPSKPVIVSIENSDGAKPQTGLMQADIIYEFMVESLITRFQVLYNDTYPMYAGPMRSLRYYFIDLAQEWDGMYLHEGGVTLDKPYKRIASKAITLYPTGGNRAFNGFSSAFSRSAGAYNDYETKNGYRFRSADREAPHNLYVLVDKTVWKYYGDHAAAVNKRFDFMEGVRYDGGESFTTVSLPYVNQFNPTWIQFQYDAASNRLLRFESGVPFMTMTPSEDGETLTKEQMSVQNLIVQYVTYGKVPKDEKDRRTCELTGTGKCDYFINGEHVTGAWSRPTLEDFTSYSLDDGSLVTLEPGNTWIAIHPDDAKIGIQ